MSLGYIGHCKICLEDDATVYYAYSGRDWNNKAQDETYEDAYDGALAIEKSVLFWNPSKPRKQSESSDWAYSAIENNQAVVLTECKNAFYRGQNIDYIAFILIRKIFDYLYQEGRFPDKNHLCSN